MRRKSLIKFIASECESTIEDMLGDPSNYGLDDNEKVGGVLLDDLDLEEVRREVAELLAK